MEGCVFCGIAEGKIPSYKVFENSQFMVTLDINPATNGHLILIPKMHYQTIIEMPEPEYQQFFSIARCLIMVLVDYGAKGVNFLYSFGEAAGQRSLHLILHIIPRYDDDKVHLIWEPKKLSEGEFKSIQSAVMAKINSQMSQMQAPMQAPRPQEAEKPAQQPKPEPIIKWERRTGAY
jgi:histidine triad (HIT) family protein